MRNKQKIVGLAALKKIVRLGRKNGRRIAFTNGCFDILHYGHIRYLQKAKRADRILIVGVNSDSSVKELKGAQRPVNPQHARAAVLAALECVDYVTIFSESTPTRLIAAIKPDILIKGADWKGKAVAGSDLVRSTGGKIEFVPFI